MCAVASDMSHSLRPYRLQPTRFLCPWDFPGNTGMGCHAWVAHESNLCLLHLLHWQVDSSPPSHQGSWLILGKTEQSRWVTEDRVMGRTVSLQEVLSPCTILEGILTYTAQQRGSCSGVPRTLTIGLVDIKPCHLVKNLTLPEDRSSPWLLEGNL